MHPPNSGSLCFSLNFSLFAIIFCSGQVSVLSGGFHLGFSGASSDDNSVSSCSKKSLER